MEFCRLCQVQEGTLNFMENQVFIQKVAECTNINIDDDNKDSLPRKVCGACKLSIDQFHVFLLNVRDVNKKLHHHLSNLLLENKKNNKSGKATKTQIKCSSCTKTFMTAKSLEIHKKAHHSNLNCDKCNVKFEDSKSAQSHVCFEVKFNEVSSFDERVQDSAWHCYKCNLKFEDSASGQNHQCLEECLMVEESQDPETDAAGSDYIPSDIEEDAESAQSFVIPEHSKPKYDVAYEKFEKWCEEKSLTDINEKVLLTYFEGKKTFKASTLWTLYSMLRSELSLRMNIDIKRFTSLIAFLKRQSSGYRAKKSNILTKENISKFLKESEDETFLMAKVAMIIGIAGACRKSELTFLRVEDVEDEESYFRVKIPNTKTKIIREFVITMGYIDGFNFVDIIRKYINLRPRHVKHNRFFVKYHSGKCGIQPVGINTFGNLPKTIAESIGLPNHVLYTGQCFRRSSASLSAHFGADALKIRRHGARSSNR